MSTKPGIRSYFPAAGIALGSLFLLATGCEQQKQAAPPPPPPEVGLATVGKQAVPIVLELSGTVTPVKQVQIIPRVSGFIFERYFEEGTFVDENDPLYLIDPRPYEDKLARLQAQIKGEQASLEFWQSEQKRYDKLAGQGAASVEQAEGARAKLHAAMATIESTQVEIHNAELDLSFTRINAPFHGRVQETQINVGNLVQAQRDVLTELVQLDPIYVTSSLSRTQAYDIQVMMGSGLAFTVEDMVIEIVMPDGQLYEKKGTLNFISNLIDPTTDSLTIRGIFDNLLSEKSGFELTPGQYVPVRATIGSLPNALVIPQSAMVETQAGTHVYVVDDANKVARRVIEPGRTHGKLLVVSKGLEEGEKVVSLGVQKVKEGVVVDPKAPTTPEESSNAPSSAEDGEPESSS